MKQRWLKIVLGIGATLVGVVLLGSILLYTALVRTLNVSDFASFSEIPANTWASIPLSEETTCSDGSDYHAYTRRGTSDNLLIHFVGGGACWDGDTCSKPITITDRSGFYFPFPWQIFRAIADGLFSLGNPNNPVQDWNTVYMPYCTADFHIGQTENTYTAPDGSSVTIQHNGRQNVSEVLDWVYATFPQPPKLMVSGESAGGFGSTFWIPTIASHYANSQVYHLTDGAFLKSPLWPEIVNTTWKADSESLGFPATDDIEGGAYRSYSAAPAPNVTYLQVNTLYDGVLVFFNAELNGVPNDAAHRELWSQEMRESTRETVASGLNYHYYLTDYGRTESGETPHTSIASNLFYEITQDGVRLQDWVKRIVMDGEAFSVGTEFVED